MTIRMQKKKATPLRKETKTEKDLLTTMTAKVKEAVKRMAGTAAERKKIPTKDLTEIMTVRKIQRTIMILLLTGTATVTECW